MFLISMAVPLNFAARAQVSYIRVRLSELIRSILSIPRASMLSISYWLSGSPSSDSIKGILSCREILDTIIAEGWVERCLTRLGVNQNRRPK